MKGTLTEKDVWQIINYLRSIGPAAGSLRRRPQNRRVRSALVVSALILAGSLGCRMFDTSSTIQSSTAPRRCRGRAPVCSRRRGPASAKRSSDFVGRHPNKPEQPVEFPHNIHVGKKIGCTEYCHEAVTTGPVAGLPSVRTCMICHNAIADRSAADQADHGDERPRRGFRVAAGVRLHAAGAREVQPRAAHPREGRVHDLSRSDSAREPSPSATST